MSSIDIRPGLSIPEGELTFRASRSGGPGGQHVNTTSSRIELVWNVNESEVLDEPTRRRIHDRLAGRISNEGNLTVASSETRSQHRNREDATERFAELLREALKPRKKRKKTKPSRASNERRLRRKKQRSEKKKLRRNPPID